MIPLRPGRSVTPKQGDPEKSHPQWESDDLPF